MAGDEIACEEFYANYDVLAGRVLRHVFPRMTSADRADIASTALERVLMALKNHRINGRSDGELRAYMSNAVKNAGLDLVTRQRTVEAGWPSEESVLPPDGSASPERVAIARTLQEDVERVLSEWSDVDRHIFIQKLQGVSAAQIRADLGRPPFRLWLEVATIDTRYWRLRQLLIRKLGERPPASLP
jgi:DNA-directed RNA polymerase specialized sigma24 family protein